MIVRNAQLFLASTAIAAVGLLQGCDADDGGREQVGTGLWRTTDGEREILDAEGREGIVSMIAYLESTEGTQPEQLEQLQALLAEEAAGAKNFAAASDPVASGSHCVNGVTLDAWIGILPAWKIVRATAFYHGPDFGPYPTVTMAATVCEGATCSTDLQFGSLPTKAVKSVFMSRYVDAQTLSSIYVHENGCSAAHLESFPSI